MGDLEKFTHNSEIKLPHLLRIAIIHYQFETIHPFLDGNGRLGRLLITLILCEAGVLREPILYLSLFLKSRRDDYYRLLQEVRQAGAWEAWMEFFLTGVAETAEQAADTARELFALFDADRQKISRLGRAAPSALRVHELLQSRPIISMRRLRPIELRLAGCGDVMKRRAVGSSSGTTRRGPYAPSTCWA